MRFSDSRMTAAMGRGIGYSRSYVSACAAISGEFGNGWKAIGIQRDKMKRTAKATARGGACPWV